MKILLAHDWFVTRGGSEKVVQELVDTFEIENILTLFEIMSQKDKDITFQKNCLITTSFLQRLPFLKYYYRYLLPFFPKIIDNFDTGNFDIIISSSHCGIKNIRKKENQIHICYCHTPVRYAWDLRQEYFASSNFASKLLNTVKFKILDRIKDWDYKGSRNVDYFIANSEYIATRINHNYNRDATVIYPPVDVENFTFQEKKEDYYIIANRLVKYKNTEIVAKAFAQMPNQKLIIVGDGPEKKNIQKHICSNIQMLDYPGKEKLSELLGKAKAFIIASNEDFGITPVEAQSTGTPTLALKIGGALEYVIEGKTGFFFEEATENSIIKSVQKYDEQFSALSPHIIRENAHLFSSARFRKQILNYVSSISSN